MSNHKKTKKSTKKQPEPINGYRKRKIDSKKNRYLMHFKTLKKLNFNVSFCKTGVKIARTSFKAKLKTINNRKSNEIL